MNTRRIFLLILVVFLGIIGGVVSASNEFIGFGFSTPETQEQLDFKIQMDQKIESFRDRVSKDVADSMGIELDNYRRIDFGEMSNEHESLTRIYLDISYSLERDDIKPYLYLDSSHSEGFIFSKKADGNNFIYIIRLVEGEWELIEKKTSTGKIINFED